MKLTDNIYYYLEPGMLDCNTYIIKDEQIMMVDAGYGKNLPLLVKNIQEDGIEPEDINILCNTHLHLDHAWANQEFKEQFRTSVQIAPIQKEYYDVGVRQTSYFFQMEPIEFEEDGILEPEVSLGNIKLDIIETPGHSPDSICFYSPDFKTLICGDLVFDRNIGRPDLPGGNMEQLSKSVDIISDLEIDNLLPGHMGIISGPDNVKANFDFIKTYIL